jgi:hypothetical protein
MPGTPKGFQVPKSLQIWIGRTEQGEREPFLIGDFQVYEVTHGP